MNPLSSEAGLPRQSQVPDPAGAGLPRRTQVPNPAEGGLPRQSQVPDPAKAGEIRHRLASLRGKEYWRTLEELAGTSEFHEFLRREFPREAAAWGDSIGRRD